MIKKPCVNIIHIAITILAFIICFACLLDRCYAEGESVTVNIELGDKHTELATKMEEHPEDWLNSYLREDPDLGVVTDVTRSGSMISITFPKELYLPRGRSVLYFLYLSMKKAIELYSNEDNVNYYHFDSGEMVHFYDENMINFRWQFSIGLKPIEDYEEYTDFEQDMESRGVYESSFNEDITYYILWRKALDSRRHDRVGVGPSESEPKAKLEVLGLPLREFPAIDEPKAMAEPQEPAAGNSRHKTAIHWNNKRCGF